MLFLRGNYPTVLDMSVHVLSNECLLTYVTDLGYKKNINTVSDPTALISVSSLYSVYI